MKQNNVKIAITGGIGSGKTTVGKIIAGLGYNVYSCDEVYAELLTQKNFVKLLADEFGEGVANSDGTLNRTALSQIVFYDRQKLDRLNEITHPKIFEEMFSKKPSDARLTFYEVPLLFEGSYQNLFDEVLVVIRDLALRVEGIKNRDNLSQTQIEARLNEQINYENYDFAMYYVIHNDSSFDSLCDIIRDILFKLTQKYHI